MKIVLYINTCLPQIGGRELVVHYLARAYKILGHEVRVVGPSAWWSSRKIKFEYPVHRFPSLTGQGGLDKPGVKSFLREAELKLQLATDLKLHGCDILHAHITYPCGYLATRLKLARKSCPVIITPHGVDIHQIPGINHGKMLNPFLRPKIQYALQHAECTTAISESIHDSLLMAGAPKGKIHLIQNGVDLARFRSGYNEDLRNAMSLSADARLIVTVGNYNLRKGHEVIINTMPEVLQREPHAILLIIGKGTNVLQPLIEGLGLQKSVILLGSVKHPTQLKAGEEDRLVSVYRNSSMYVSAGIEDGAEGLSLAVLEAMASGLPIVASKISGNTDIIVNEHNGLLVEPSKPRLLAEKLLYFLKNEDKRLVYAKNAEQTTSEYDWIEIAKKYIHLYEEAKKMI